MLFIYVRAMSLTSPRFKTYKNWWRNYKLKI